MHESGKGAVKALAGPIAGAQQAGITRKIASRVGDRIVEAFEQKGRRVRVKGMRFIPSTKVDFGQGAFQVMANTIVEAISPAGGPTRAEAIESVVTVSQARSQVLETVKIPFLDQMRSRV